MLHLLWMIPNILHQFFISNAKLHSIPTTWANFTKKTCRIHPIWEYKLWNNDYIKKITSHYYPHMTEYFTDNVLPVVQADIGRYLALKHFGGWYFDFDYELFRPLDSFRHKKIILPLEQSKETIDSNKKIGNAILASEAQHWFWDLVLDQLPPPEFFKQKLSNDDILNSTGPDKLTLLYNTLSQSQQQEITLPKEIAFHTTLPIMMSSNEYNTIKNNKKVFGIHHTHSSWRDNNLHKNLRRRKYATHWFSRILLKIWNAYKQRKN